MGRQEKSRLLAENKIQCMPLQFLRGANLDKCVIIADEMQNSSLVEIKTLLTRLKEDAQLIMTGDLGQCDLEEGKSGFAKVIEILQEVEGVSFINFGVEDILRSGIVKQITLAFKAHNL